MKPKAAELIVSLNQRPFVVWCNAGINKQEHQNHGKATEEIEANAANALRISMSCFLIKGQYPLRGQVLN